MKPLHYYFVGSATWFLAYGLQSVVFAWLVTIVLDESPNKVGIAQMALLLPTMIFMLIGGSLADQFGGRRLVIFGHLCACVAPFALTLVLVFFDLTYTTVIVFAVLMGFAQAMVTPARDGLLPLVADGAIQRRVMQASMIQFGVQMVGFGIASMADRFGAAVMLTSQSAILALGALAYSRMQIPFIPPAHAGDGPLPNIGSRVRDSIIEGFKSVRASQYMRIVVLQNCAMGTFFMGSYIVTLPLVVRDVYAGTSVQLAWLNIGNSLGLVLTIIFLLRLGDVYRQGRALLLAQGIGALALAGGGLGLGFPSLVFFIFLWGMCGGLSMTMARTIMQEQSPPDQRGRMMAFFSFSFMGSGPFGALLSGYLCEWFGPTTALSISATAMLIVIVIVAIRSSLWGLDATPVRLAST